VALSIEGLSKSFGGRLALAPTSLHFATGRTTVLLGPTGCGKITLHPGEAGLRGGDPGRPIGSWAGPPT
jgi:ABC-type Fe3+/spermidine/putrescine transport system ATPase subunit